MPGPRLRRHQLTAFGLYMEDTGTTCTWLAEMIGVSPSKVCRWKSGAAGIGGRDRRRVLEVLHARAQTSLEGIFDDQLPLGSVRSGPRAGRRPWHRIDDE